MPPCTLSSPRIASHDAAPQPSLLLCLFLVLCSISILYAYTVIYTIHTYIYIYIYIYAISLSLYIYIYIKAFAHSYSMYTLCGMRKLPRKHLPPAKELRLQQVGLQVHHGLLRSNLPRVGHPQRRGASAAQTVFIWAGCYLGNLQSWRMAPRKAPRKRNGFGGSARKLAEAWRKDRRSNRCRC